MWSFVKVFPWDEPRDFIHVSIVDLELYEPVITNYNRQSINKTKLN